MIYINIILFLVSVILLYITSKIKTNKNQQIKEAESKLISIQTQLEALQKTLQSRQIDLANLYQQITYQKKQVINLQKQRDQLKEEIDTQIKERRTNLNELYGDLQQKTKQAFYSYENNLDKAYQQKEQEIKNQIKEIQKQKEDYEKARDAVNDELIQLKGIYQAATAARLRQEEEQEKWSFYRIRITDQQANDISNLMDWKSKLYDPSIVSKIIWSSYIIKPTSDMCNRVLGTTKPICGIYKITNKSTGQIYIGQSVNIADRWKAHIKCGLGIDASSTNKLYNNMQSTGVWNFTFEVLQTCSRDKLNEKERFWIDMYQSNKIGLNIQRGNK